MARPSLIERIGAVIRLWQMNCLPSPWLLLAFIGPALLKALFSLLPTDNKGSYHFATGESWVCTTKRVMRNAGSADPYLQGVKSAAFEMLELADKTSWYLYIASVAAEFFANWTSGLFKYGPCAGRHQGYAVTVLFGFPGGDDWQAVLMLDQYDPDGWFGINSLHVPANYQAYGIGFSPSFIPILPGNSMETRVIAIPDDPHVQPQQVTVLDLPPINPDGSSAAATVVDFKLDFRHPITWSGIGMSFQAQCRNTGTGIAAIIPGCTFHWDATHV